MISTTLIAVGLAMLYPLLNYEGGRQIPIPVQIVLGYGGPALIGIGALVPFRRPILGAVAALVATAVIIWLT
jgi:hypothetical protein